MHGYEKIVNARFNSSAEQLQGVRDAIRNALVKKGCSIDFIDDFVLASNEACANIILHAYKGDASGNILLEMYYRPNEVIVCFTDYAEKVDLDLCKSRSLEEIRPGGLGIHFMKELMDDVRFLENRNGSGNVLQMKKKLLPA